LIKTSELFSVSQNQNRHCVFLLSLIALFSLLLPKTIFAAATADIQVDQVGYLSTETKLAMVTNTSASGTFYLVSTSGPSTVLTGTLSATNNDSDSGLAIRYADFSSVTVTGNYYVYAVGLGQSVTFGIGPNALSNAFYETMRFYFVQRCGMAITVVNAGTTWIHGACHTTGAADSDDPATYHASTGKTGTKVSTQGWHDAGDYGKYIVNANISVGELLWAFEWYKSALSSFNLNIPESGNGTPDILNECKWELQWMLTMQEANGGVWAKVTSAGFPAGPPTPVMPENDNAGTRYIIGTGNAPYEDAGATAGFAAVMAIASRVYQPYDSTFASTCLTAAENAWTWANANPNSTVSANPTGITTGVYNDNGNSTPSYLLWAAAELYRTTGTATYNTYFINNYNNAAWSYLIKATEYPQDWTNTKNLAFWSYYFSGQSGVSAAVTTAIYNATLSTAQAVTARQSTVGYRVSLETSDYIWGSNGGVGNYGILLLMANAMSPNANYVQAALDDVHYLLGRNGNKMSFVTDLGSNFQMNPHHRPSWSDGITLPWPGMLCGGPNAGGGDGITPTSAGGTKPALCYIDNNNAYASNEEAINWNSPLVFVLASTLSTGTPTPTPTSTLTRTSTATSTPTSTASKTPTPTLTSSPTASLTNTMTSTASSTGTSTPTSTITPTPSETPTRTFTMTLTSTLSSTITPTLTSTSSSTGTKTATLTSTSTQVNTATATATSTPSSTATGTASSTATKTATATATLTPTATPSSTNTKTYSPTITESPTNSPTGTLTPSLTPTPSSTPTITPTLTHTPTGTWTNTSTLTSTLTVTSTPSSTSTNSPVASPTPTFTTTKTATLTPTATWTVPPALTSTPTFTDTVAPTLTLTPTMTWTPTVPVGIVLLSPYPNPSWGEVPVNFGVTTSGQGTLKWSVFTVSFRKVASGIQSIDGSGNFQWDLRDRSGTKVSLGLYYVRIEVVGTGGSIKKIFKILVL
jgi:endoglucanase